ncbi:N-6 DNA methylase [Sediminibacillus dalangtanensis]|uniref:N-6 DNA methylase n=1 Tax=Sediminibacillus dalangtanensis TaxID=2729421 RepID=A0ABX7VX83_9BACI|nr:N-6 DNA methylase [Sediminibacillus dalangtanensis]QTN01149.1 N-6 DNA methylase [Sediminibacillus dalangtanensis]
MAFNPNDYPELFTIKDDRIYYNQTNKGGTPKNYKWSDPEEKVRAKFYYDLVHKYDYPAHRIDLEVEVYRRKPEDFADIVIYEDNEFNSPYLVVECKEMEVSEPDFEQAIKQAWGNANNLAAEYAVAVAGKRLFAFEPKSFNYKNRNKYALNIPERYGKPIKYRLIKGDPEWDVKPSSLEELRSAFQKCHDILWEGGKRNPSEAFDEMSKLLFCKLQDERHETGDGEAYKFQIGTHEQPNEVATRVKDIYADSRSRMPHVFQSSIKISEELIYKVVEEIQEVSLYKTDLDAKGRAFEKFLGTVFREKMGQYFTPRPVVNFMVDMVNPTVRNRIIDPACGSGGFLLYALEKIQQEANDKFKDVISRRDYWKDWSLRSLHGVEINDQISRVAMMGMILHEDGHTNIQCADSLQSFSDMKNITTEFQPESFDIILTNPPFGASVKRVNKRQSHPVLDEYELGGKERNGQKTEILFIERCLDLLVPGGKMGIVLPEGIFNNPSLEYVRDFVEGRAFIDGVISLPLETFIASGASVKTSILFIKKFTKEETLTYNQKYNSILTKKIKEYSDTRDEIKEHYQSAIDCYDRSDIKALQDEISHLNQELETDLSSEEKKKTKAKIKDLKSNIKKIITKEDRDNVKKLKKEYNSKMKELEEKIIMETKQKLKEELNYKVFMANVDKAGVTATGDSAENELPEIYKRYKEFRKKKPLKFNTSKDE